MHIRHDFLCFVLESLFYLALVLAMKTSTFIIKWMLNHPNADWKPERNVQIITKTRANTCAGCLCGARLRIAIQPEKDRATLMYIQTVPDKKHYKISWSALILEYIQKINETFNSRNCCCLIVRIWQYSKFQNYRRILMSLVCTRFLNKVVTKNNISILLLEMVYHHLSQLLGE